MNFSFKVFAEVGDIYMCEMTENLSILDHKITNYRLENFKFLRSTKELRFGNEENTFQDYTVVVSGGSGEMFWGGNEGLNLFTYDNGNFVWARADVNDGSLITAKCTFF